MKTSYFLKKSGALAISFMFALSFQSNAQKQATIDGIIYQVVEVEGGDNYAETVPLAWNGDKVVPYTAETIAIPAKVTIDGTEFFVKKIGDHSMRENPNLKSITLPEGLEIIGNSSFAQCPEITEVVVPATVKSIEDWAFYGCSKLAKINIPDGITAITEHTFQETNLTSIELPASVTSLGTCAFQTARKLASINLENITEIKSWALGETALTSVDLSNIKSIGGAAFYTCPELETVLLGESKIIQTSEWTFQNCPKLTKVTLPNTLESIDGGAFSGCSALKSVVIPNSVQFLGAWAFEKSAITEIFASWENPEDLITDENIFGSEEGKINFTWKVPEEVKAAWGNEFLGYPVEIGTPETANEFLKIEANVYYTAGTLYITNLSGYNTFVYSLDGRAVAHFNVNTDSYNASVSLAPGIYVLKAANGNKIATTKFAVR
ncbi:MAG: leucine-rich repeat domain-containing protein [Tannerella sp.]|jgi:hypothetical protein|nr:leucine-rich repeat domain-containing protein [Tannerella sp.]